jgi:pimeloyl-ACP methyl ester carboxylesterase
MRIGTATTLLLAVMLCTTARAADLSGTWQGTDKSQHVLKITKAPGGFRGEFYNLGDEQPGFTRNGNSISSITITGRAIRFKVDNTGDTFSGELSADGKHITGSWTFTWYSTPPHDLTLERATKKTEWTIDPSPHKTQFVTVEKGVKLEVLDWGGSGTPMIFLAGLGNSAHVFDTFAPKFTSKHHVYGITRRAFGASSVPPPSPYLENYDADRLGDDVLAVIETLHIERPVLVGHSMAGEELSSVGTRHPEKVAGLIYLAASQARAFYELASDTPDVDADVVSHDLQNLYRGSVSDQRALVDKVLATLPRLQASFERLRGRMVNQPDGPPQPSTPRQDGTNAMFVGERKYVGIKPPFLAIVSVPPRCQPNCDLPAAKADAAFAATQIDAIEADYPNGHVVRLPYASHYVFRSNEADVEREMNAFMDSLH